MTRDEFFAAVDGLLGPMAPGQTGGRENWHKGPEHIRMRGRWHRGAGQGRYPGRGLIRYHSVDNIHVMLRDPELSKTFDSPEQALEAIGDLLPVWG